MAVDPVVAELIREVLAEELALLRPERREEWVRIGDDADLAAFAKRVLTLAEDRGARDALESERLVFRLDGGTRGGGRGGAGGGVETLERGLLSERQVARLPRGTTRVRAGRDVTITPLARDRLRRMGITIERTET